jgi:hypothetical protein
MFKKIEIWVLYLIILLSIVFALGFRVLVRQELVGRVKARWISESALMLAELRMNIKKMLLSELMVEDKFPNLDGFDGTPNSAGSYVLLSKYDGEFKEGIVGLVDLTNFEVLHTWNPFKCLRFLPY